LDVLDGRVFGNYSSGSRHVGDFGDVVGIVNDGIVNHSLVDIGDLGNICRSWSIGIGAVPQAHPHGIVGGRIESRE
jgi:hypothetical protein